MKLEIRQDAGFRSLQELQDVQAAWVADTFPGITTKNKLDHLRKEIDEIESNPSDVAEYADAIMILTSAAHGEGISVEAITKAAWEKIEINKTRKWAQGRDGVFEHKRENRK